MTFDDGSYKLTNQLLDHLKQAGVKATFFVNGYNIGNIYQYDWIIKCAYRERRQNASRTWGHADLMILSYDQIHNQMTQRMLFAGCWRAWDCFFGWLVAPPWPHDRYLNVFLEAFFFVRIDGCSSFLGSSAPVLFAYLYGSFFFLSN